MPTPIAERVAEHRRNLRALFPDRIRQELAELDERRLGRRRLASEERRFRRLSRELAALPPEPETET